MTPVGTLCVLIGVIRLRHDLRHYQSEKLSQENRDQGHRDRETIVL